MNSKYQSGEKININNIFFEDSFIDLINELSKSIQEYYHPTLGLISNSYNFVSLLENNINQIISLIEKNNNILLQNNKELFISINNLKSIIDEFKLISIKSEENLKSFIEKSKIFLKK